MKGLSRDTTQEGRSEAGIIEGTLEDAGIRSEKGRKGASIL